jgi:tetratricopeptide (TPR) repeat protein
MNNPRDFNLVNQLAQVYAQLKQPDRIPLLLQNYLTQTNLPADDLLQAAQVYLNINQAEPATRTLQFMMQQFPQDARSYFAFGMIRAAQNNAAEALPMLEKAIQLAPQLRAQLLNDQRFGNLRNNPQFQKLVNPQ